MVANRAYAVPDTAPGDAEGLRDRILKAATRLFATRGFAETSMREIVSAAGCTKPALYYYFTNKESLFREAVVAADQLLDGGELDGRTPGSLREGLLAALRHVADAATREPHAVRLLFRAEAYAASDNQLIDTRPIRAKHLALIEELLSAGVESGDVRSDVSIEDAAIALVGILHCKLQMFLDGRPLTPDFAERIVSIYMDGVSQRRDGETRAR